jgi:hypothetical protein
LEYDYNRIIMLPAISLQRSAFHSRDFQTDS